MVSYLLLLACVACVTAVQLEDVADVEYGQSRQPKLFYVSSSATTSSVTTTTQCYVTNAALVTCGKRRKRNILVNSILGEAGQIDPQRARWEEI